MLHVVVGVELPPDSELEQLWLVVLLDPLERGPLQHLHHLLLRDHHAPHHQLLQEHQQSEEFSRVSQEQCGGRGREEDVNISGEEEDSVLHSETSGPGNDHTIGYCN